MKCGIGMVNYYLDYFRLKAFHGVGNRYFCIHFYFRLILKARDKYIVVLNIKIVLQTHDSSW